MGRISSQLSMVNFGGTARTTTYVSATQLTAAIPAAAIAQVGTAAVTVTNPAPGGGTSNAVNFTITGGTNPVPTINSLSPSCAPQGEQVLDPFVNGQLLVNGQNFLASSVVRWNGNGRPTTFYTNSQLTAQISASDIAAAGTVGVTVFNPAPGGGNSNISTFTITAGGVSPQSIAVDRTGRFAYVANEGGFAPTSVSMFTINGTTGALTSIGTIAAGGRAISVAVDPTGKFTFAANGSNSPRSAGNVSMYDQRYHGGFNVHRNNSCGNVSYIDRHRSVRKVRLRDELWRPSCSFR